MTLTGSYQISEVLIKVLNVSIHYYSYNMTITSFIVFLLVYIHACINIITNEEGCRDGTVTKTSDTKGPAR